MGVRYGHVVAVVMRKVWSRFKKGRKGSARSFMAVSGCGCSRGVGMGKAKE